MNLVLLLTSALLLMDQELIDAAKILTIRFQPGTSVFPGKRDGIVIVRTDIGEALICNDGFDELKAAAVCRSMGFPGLGYSLQSKSVPKDLPLTMYGVDCGPRLLFTECIFSLKTTKKSKCKIRRYAHVYCLFDKTEDERKYPLTNCDPIKTNYRLYTGYTTKKNSGYLNIFYKGNYHFVCDSTDELYSEAADYFCGKVCSSVTNPMIERKADQLRLSSKYVEVKKFGSEYRVLKNVNKCPPHKVIGLVCGDEIPVKEPPPRVSCSSQTMNLTWPSNHKPRIDDSLITLMDGCNANGSYEISYNSTSGLTVQISLSDIKIIQTTESDILYICKLLRRYESDTMDAKSLLATCQVPRSANAFGNITFKHRFNFQLTDTFNVPSILEMFQTNRFRNKLDKPYKIEGGGSIFAKHSLVNPPGKTKLVLREVYLTDNVNVTSSKKVYLVKDGCATRLYDTRKYIRLGKTVVGLAFKPEAIRQKFNKKRLYLVFKGMKCLNPSRGGCRYCRMNLRNKRSTALKSDFKDLPILHEPIEFV